MTRKTLLTIKPVMILLMLLFTFLSCELVEDETIEESQQEEEYNLEELQGNWIRVGGNNPINNGMTIEVLENQGTIINPVESGFEKNDIKWLDIRAISEMNFEYKELGSDSNYYPSLLFFQEDDTLRVDVNHSGAGNYQKWIRLE